MRFFPSAKLGVVAVGLLLVACEAPLDLSGVEQSKQRSVLRTDMFQAAASSAARHALVSSTGAALHKEHAADNWQRTDLPGRPSLIDISACANGDFVALDAEHRVWHLPATSSQWQANTIDTPEPTLAIACGPGNKIWVGGGFSTLWSSADFGGNWQEFSLQEDLQFTSLSFVNESLAYAAGEFGTVIVTKDGGKTWQRGGDLPNEFYPMDMLFIDEQQGWVVGLNGIVWYSKDGGNSWVKEETPVNTSLFAVTANAGAIYAVGDGGVVLQRGDQGWQRVQTPAALTYLRAITVAGNGELIAAGGAGTVVQQSLASATAE